MRPLTPEQYWALTPPLKFTGRNVYEQLNQRGLVARCAGYPAEQGVYGPTPLGELALRVYERYVGIRVE